MRSPPPGASVAALLSIGLLCGLGTWQVQRLHWKTALLAQIDRAYADPAPPFVGMAQFRSLPQGPNDFTAGRITGHFLPGEIQLGPRGWQEENGYHVLVPFALEAGGTIIVDRGWVPTASKNPASRPASLPPGGTMTVTGILHAPGPPNPFVPVNRPDQALWYRWDVPAMAQTLGIKGGVAPMVLLEEKEPSANALPVRAALRPALPNDHFQYACFWFTTAGVLAVMFYLRFVRGKTQTFSDQ